MVSVVDSQGRGYCVEAKYSLLELSVLALLLSQTFVIHTIIERSFRRHTNVHDIVGAPLE